MLTMFSALAIQNATPRNKPYILTDSVGLHLLVKPNGTKLWRLSAGRPDQLAYLYLNLRMH